MQKFEPLQFGSIYHIYNKGINGADLFVEARHYYKFLWLYEKHITPVADTFAWCLLRNHFHLLVRCKDKKQLQADAAFGKTLQPGFDSQILVLRFSALFNAYAQSFNYSTERTGGLFHTPFKRKTVHDPEYFKSLVFYIHNNPVKHGFCERVQEYPWSSYSSVISFTPTFLQKEKVIGWFHGKANFVSFHQEQTAEEDITGLLFD